MSCAHGRGQEASHQERKGITPFAKEPTVFKAKPARKVVMGQRLARLSSDGASESLVTITPSGLAPARHQVELAGR